MRVPTTDAFNSFLLANGLTYPYSQLKPTRNSFFCKWIMTKGHDNVTEYFPVLANSFSHQVLLEMITTGMAKPFPPELSEIMDHMHWWGKHKSIDWFDSVVQLSDAVLNKEEDIRRSELVRVMIIPQVLAEIRAHFSFDSVAEHLLLLEWTKFFDITYNNNMSFRTIASLSIESVQYSIYLMKNA
jgi:hypothetical protein